jgi:hypothetical protein
MDDEIKNNDNTADQEEVKNKEYDLTNIKNIFDMFRSKESEDNIKQNIIKSIKKLQTKYKLTNYKIIFLSDDYSNINSYNTDRIYETVKDLNNKKDILLILDSAGGSGEPSYLLSKALKRLSKSKFIVVVPRRAKSAATLLSLGADEIHMGLMSELGPIDLQVGRYPALGLGNSLEYIAKIVSKYPNSYKMFATYLTNKLDLINLGYFERLGESTVQYGERLIGDKKLPQDTTAQSIAKKLVYDYKDHNFVIDLDEAKNLFGEDIIKENTEEYGFANEVYTIFDFTSKLFLIFRNKEFSYVGDIDSGFSLSERTKK